MHSLGARAGDKIVYFMGIDKARFEAEFADFIEIKKKADSLVRAD